LLLVPQLIQPERPYAKNAVIVGIEHLKAKTLTVVPNLRNAAQRQEGTLDTRSDFFVTKHLGNVR